MWFLIAAGSSLSLCVYLYLYNIAFFEPNRDKLPPGTLGLPFIGHTLSFLMDPIGFRKRLMQGGKTMAKINILFSKSIQTVGPDNASWIFKGENKFLQSTWPKTWLALLGSNSVSTVHGETHKRQRQLLSHAFTPNYLPVVESITRAHLERWNKMGRFDIFPNAKQWGLDVAASVLLGVSLDGDNSKKLTRLFTDWIAGFSALIPYPLPGTAMRKALRARKEILAMSQEIIDQVRKSPVGEFNTAIQIMMNSTDESGKMLNDDELKDQVLVQLFAGHDTTAATISSTMMVLNEYPDVRERLENEIKENFPNKDEPIDFNVLKNMKYIDAVLKEVLRYYPPIGGGFRRVTETQEHNGYIIPKGWNLLYSVYSNHWDPKLFPEPSKFDPERFLEREEDKKIAYAFIPFGGGVRMCLGMELAKLELKVMLVHMIREYSWKVTGKPKVVGFPLYRIESEVEVGKKI